MAHLSIFKKFDDLKEIGQSFFLPLKPYKDFNSARGTISSGATDYRKARNKNFYVSSHQINKWTAEVTRVDNVKWITRSENDVNQKKAIERLIKDAQTLSSKSFFAKRSDELISNLKKQLADSFQEIEKVYSQIQSL